jgi:uncharacterized membrane protein YraQ (UPF0718 family)/copper chaperone CopZ
MIEYINQFGASVYGLFFEMAPYLMLGLTVAGALSVLVKKSFVARHIGGTGFGAVIKSSVLGVPLPLCSCGVVPTASYLRRSGASKPALVSFLISTPQTGVDSIAATYGMLGPLFAWVRPLMALITGVIGGGVSSLAMRDEDREPASAAGGTEGAGPDEPRRGLLPSIRDAAAYGYSETVDDIAPQFVLGLIIAGLITMLIPDGFFEGTIIAGGLPGMLLMVAIGVPMYICSTSSIPIAVALIAKGISPGAAYVFLVAGPATNAATLMILHRVLGMRHTLVYLFTIVAGSLAFGPLVNLLAEGSGWVPPVMAMHEGHAESLGILNYLTGIALFALIAAALFRRYSAKLRSRFAGANDAESGAEHSAGAAENADALFTTLSVEGMTCNHCVANVESAVRGVTGVSGVRVDLASGRVRVEGPADAGELVRAVDLAGYKASV